MTKKEVATIDSGTGEILPEVVNMLPAAFLAQMEADAGDRQAFDQDQLIIPRYTILQALSPAVTVGDAAYIEGALPGMIHNTVTGELTSELVFVPAFYNVRHIVWKTRRSGGGLIDADYDPKLLKTGNWKQENPGKWVGPHVIETKDGQETVNAEVVKTGEWAGVACRADGSILPAAISFPSSKSKIARKMNTKVDTTEIPTADGGFFTPPPYVHRFSLKTGTEQGPEGPFFNYVANHTGFSCNPDGSVSRAYLKAQELREAILAGEADMSEITPEG